MAVWPKLPKCKNEFVFLTSLLKTKKEFAFLFFVPKFENEKGICFSFAKLKTKNEKGIRFSLTNLNTKKEKTDQDKDGISSKVLLRFQNYVYYI